MHGERLQNIRKTLRLSQDELATQTGISYRAYTSYERGDRKPALEFLDSLYRKFNVNMNYLISGEGELFNTQQPSVDNTELEQKVVEVMKKYGVIEK